MNAFFAATMATAVSFCCKRCGRCCEGTGGIIISDTDLGRLCEHLAVVPDEFLLRWGERRGGKLCIRSSQEGYCVFFEKNLGCTVHTAKPDVCRAWPYFRGNLVDAESFALAKAFCLGLPAEQTHKDFVSAGIVWLCKEKLLGNARPEEATALQVTDILSFLT